MIQQPCKHFHSWNLFAPHHVFQNWHHHGTLGHNCLLAVSLKICFKACRHTLHLALKVYTQISIILSQLMLQYKWSKHQMLNLHSLCCGKVGKDQSMSKQQTTMFMFFKTAAPDEPGMMIGITPMHWNGLKGVRGKEFVCVVVYVCVNFERKMWSLLKKMVFMCIKNTSLFLLSSLINYVGLSTIWCEKWWWL